MGQQRLRLDASQHLQRLLQAGLHWRRDGHGRRQEHLSTALEFRWHLRQPQHRRVPGEGVEGRVGLGVGGVVSVLLELDTQAPRLLQ
jgi:hypothetical protein